MKKENELNETFDFIKRKFKITDAEFAKMFNYKNVASYKNSSGKEHVEEGLCRFYLATHKLTGSTVPEIKAIDFPEVNVRIAEDQPEYETLPAFYNNKDGTITFGFELSKNEIERIVIDGEIWIQQITFGQAMQPIKIGFAKEDFIKNQENG